MSEERLIPTYIPPLVYLLGLAEKEKGSPLTRDEVLAVRNSGVCIVLRESEVRKLAEARGYEDIDPDAAWEAWQARRK